MAPGRYGKKSVVSKNRREKKDIKMIPIKDEINAGELLDGEEIIKIIDHYGKRYAVVKKN